MCEIVMGVMCDCVIGSELVDVGGGFGCFFVLVKKKSLVKCVELIV